MLNSPGKEFRQLVNHENPLQIVGAINAYCGLQAKQVGFKAAYVSGAGVANACYGLPDLGITSLDNVTTEVARIYDATGLPLLVDADTGWGNVFNISRTVKHLIKAGAAAMHIEDQIAFKRCGHRPNKTIVSVNEMVNRITSAVEAKLPVDENFVIMARTDAIASEGVDAAIHRAQQYVAAGADMLFPEAIDSLQTYRKFCSAVSVPVLANLTEFGQTPLLTVDELRQAGVKMALYPLSAFRAMAKAAEATYQTIYHHGTQVSAIKTMQTRSELYEVLDYYSYERALDTLLVPGSDDE